MLYLTLDALHKIGNVQQFGTHSNKQENLAVMFEDDGQTAYFYAIDMNKNESVVDSLHVYNVESIVNVELQNECKLQICWSEGGNVAILLLNDQPYAAFDFVKLIGYNHSHFPEPELGSMWSREKLDHNFISNVLR